MDDSVEPERQGPPGVVWALALVFTGFELASQLAQAGILLPRDFDQTVLIDFAFFDPFGPLSAELTAEGLRPVWAQAASFLTYAFLHGGLLHFLMNGAIFLALGGAVANSLGAARFLILFAVTAIGGAAAFALISSAQGPLVGASGAIFGLFGVLKRWEWRWIRVTGARANRFWGTIAALILMNLALFLFYPGDGAVAWEAHLGGFVAGWLIAPLLAPRRASPSPI